MLKAERKWIDWMIRQKNILLFLIVTCLAILARVGGLSFVSADMNDYLLPWAEQFRANSGFSAMRSQIGDYNILYQTLIVLICRLPGSMVYLYKYIWRIVKSSATQYHKRPHREISNLNIFWGGGS